MVSFQRLFREQNSHIAEHDGRIYHRYFPIKVEQSIKLKFKFISSKSAFFQAIDIHLPREFDGDVFIKGKKVPVKKTAFPQLIFWMDLTPAEFELIITQFNGEIKICNGSDPLGTKELCASLGFGCAMIVEPLGENRWRFYCNDHEYDDDCDDLVFEMEVQSTHEDSANQERIL